MSIRSILVFLIGFSGYSTLQAQDAVKPHVLVIGIDGLRPDAMQKAKTPNMNAAMVTERCVPLVKQLREARPDTPIVLVEDRRFPNSWLVPGKSKFRDDNHAALRKAYRELQTAGVKHLYYVEGDPLLGDDFEGTTDASHPNDLGFLRQAEVFAPVLRKALGLK